MDISSEQIIRGITGLVIVIISLTFHEWGHASMADQFGDDTPRRMGRVTFNPAAHVDPIGTIFLPLLAVFLNFPIIGWAKPVFINPGNLPQTRQRAWVTIAGPGMNLLLAVITAIALGLLPRFGMTNAAPYVSLFMLININLMMFNLLPVPPLDGSKFLMYWFGMSERAYAEFARFGWIILMVLINIPQTQKLFGQMLMWAREPFQTIAAIFLQF